MRRRLLTVLALTATLTLFASSALAQTPSADGDDRVTGHPYVRHDGGTDRAIQECSSLVTNPAPDNVADDGDLDSNDGGNRRQNNEPFSVVDPTNPNAIVAGWPNAAGATPASRMTVVKGPRMSPDFIRPRRFNAARGAARCLR